MKKTAFLVAFLMSFFGFSQVQTLPTLYATEDAYTSSGVPGTPYGGYGTLEVSKTASSTFRSFLKFNLSSIPPNAVITSAILKLTPSGTEGITATNSSQLYLDVCNTSWTEGGITNSSNISNNTLCPTVTVSNLDSSKRTFQIKDFVQAIADGRMANNGWRIRRNDETTNATTVYYSRENATLDNRPRLIIQYYLRSYVSAATIVHTSTLTNNDGSISPTIMQGSSTTMTYRWFNSSGTQIGTSQNLTGVGKGWYGLKYYGSVAGDTTYQAFIVGTECEDVSITFDPGPNYIDDARFTDFVSGSGTSAINYPQANSGSNILMLHERWTNGGVWYSARDVIKFRVWVDPGCQVNSAVMTLVGNVHNPLQTPNTSELCRITANWSEFGVAHTNMPASTPTGKITVPAIAAGNGNATPDIASFFNIWKNDNVQNYGMLFQLQSYASNLYTRMQFHSSDATTANLRPKVGFSITVNTCDLSRKGTLVTTDLPAELKTQVVLNINPPSWAIAPYRYVISENPIQNPRDVLAYLNDSLFDPDIDSTDFFKGNTSSSTMNFGGVDYGKYYIAVFDNGGNRIYEKSSIEFYPAITLASASNATVVNDNMIRPKSSGNAYCDLSAYMNTYCQGKVSFVPEALSGNHYYGFADVSRNVSAGTDIRYGFYLSGTKLYTISNYVVSSKFYSATVDKEIGMRVVNDTIVFTNDSTIVAKVALGAGYSFKVSGVMNTASRTRVRLINIVLKPFFLYAITTSSVERTCSVPVSNFEFKVSGFFSGLFGNYNYTLESLITNNIVASGTSSNSNTTMIPNLSPGIYRLTCAGALTISKNIYVGIQAEWFPTHPNYNITPNSYSVLRDNVNPITTYSSAITTNIMSAGTTGAIWFTPKVLTAFGPSNSPNNNRYNYLTIASTFGNLLQPSSSETYLVFRRELAMMYPVGSGMIGTPGGLRVFWRDGTLASSGSAFIPDNSLISIIMLGTTMTVKAGNTVVTTITQPNSSLRIKANSNRFNEGFEGVHTTFGCTQNQTLNQVGYYELARDYTAGYAIAVQGKLKFTFDEEYSIENLKNLQYVLYDDLNNPIASCDMLGQIIGGAIPLTYSFDDNRYELSLPSVAVAGNFYHFEVTTSTGQKRVLRFLYKN